MARKIILKNNGLKGTLPNGIKALGLDEDGVPSLLTNSTIEPITDSIPFYLALNFIDLEQFLYVAPENFKITTISNPSSLSVTITVNDLTYTLGNSIDEFDVIKVSVNSTGFIKLNCEKI
jgi:hypothetical protein